MAAVVRWVIVLAAAVGGIVTGGLLALVIFHS